MRSRRTGGLTAWLHGDGLRFLHRCRLSGQNQSHTSAHVFVLAQQRRRMLGSSRRPRITDAKNIYEMISDRTVGAATQAAKKICQLAGIEGIDNGARIHPISNLVAQGHGVRQALHCLNRRAVCQAQLV